MSATAVMSHGQRERNDLLSWGESEGIQRNSSATCECIATVSSGHWSCNQLALYDCTGGTTCYTVTATERNAAGVRGPTATFSFAAVSPTAQVTTPASGATLHTHRVLLAGTSSDGIGGIPPAGTTVLALVSGPSTPQCTATTAPSGSWVCGQNGGSVGIVADGVYQIGAQVLEANGGFGSPSTSPFTVDTKPTITRPTGGVTNITGSTASVNFSGTRVGDGPEIRVCRKSAGFCAATASVCGDSGPGAVSWSCGGALQAGTDTYNSYEIDAVGGGSPASADFVLVVNNLPATVNASSGQVFFTSSNPIPLSGACASGETVTAAFQTTSGAAWPSAGTQARCSTTCANSQWSCSVPVPPAASGSGLQLVVSQVAPDSTSAPDQVVTGLTCSPCPFSLSSPGISAPSVGMSGTFNVTSPAGCSWTAMSDSPWLTTTNTGTGNGSVAFDVAQNTSTGGRSGTITVGGQTFTVTQSGVFPTNLVATGTSTPSVSLTWSSSTVAHFEVWRNAGSGFVLLSSPTMASYTDSAVMVNNAYVYKVRAVDSSVNVSGYSNLDLATTISFTDDPLIAQSTVVKAEHLRQLRMAVNAVRALAGLGSVSFTDPTLSSAIFIKATHVTDLRNALDPARASLGLPAMAYTDSSLTGVTVKATHLQELRAGVQ